MALGRKSSDKKSVTKKTVDHKKEAAELKKQVSNLQKEVTDLKVKLDATSTTSASGETELLGYVREEVSRLAALNKGFRSLTGTLRRKLGVSV